MTESIVDFNNDKEFPIATMFYCLKITGLLIVFFLMSNKYLYINIPDKTAPILFYDPPLLRVKINHIPAQHLVLGRETQFM